MKYLFLVVLFLLPAVALANNCNNPDAVQAAQTALLHAYNGTDPSDISLSNISATTLTDGTPVCIGEVTTPDFTTNAVWAVAQTPMGWDASVIQAVDPQHYVQNPAAQQEEQRQSDQQTANEIAAGMQKMKPTCDLVENHPAKAALKALSEGKPISNIALVRQKCKEMEAIAAQAAQMEQQEGITPKTNQSINDQSSQGNNQ